MPSDKDTDINVEPLTETRVHELINKALAASGNRTEKRLQEILEQSLSSFKEQLSAPKPEVSKESQASPEVIALQKKLEKMEKDIKDKELALAAQAKETREKEGFRGLKGMLSGKIRPENEEMIAEYLWKSGKVSVDEEGKLSWADASDPDAGLKQFLKSKEASAFLPAPVAKQAAHSIQEKGTVAGITPPVIPGTPAATSQNMHNVNFADIAAQLAKLGLPKV